MAKDFYTLFFLPSLIYKRPKPRKYRTDAHITHNNIKPTNKIAVQKRRNGPKAQTDKTRTILCRSTHREPQTRVKILINEETRVLSTSSWPSPLQVNAGTRPKHSFRRSNRNLKTHPFFIWARFYGEHPSKLFRDLIPSLQIPPTSLNQQTISYLHCLRHFNRRASANFGWDLIWRTKPSIEDRRFTPNSFVFIG